METRSVCEIFLKGSEEQITNFLKQNNLTTEEICLLIVGGVKMKYLDMILPEKSNEIFFEHAAMSNKLDVLKFLLKKFPDADLQNAIGNLFYYAFVKFKNWEMTCFLESLGFPLTRHLSPNFITMDGNRNFENYKTYLKLNFLF